MWPSAPGGSQRLALALALGVAIGCGYSPNPASGKLICGPQSSCPEGYRCASNLCWSGAEPELLGTWTFGATSTQVTTCDDKSTDTMKLQGPDGFVEVTPGGATSVLASEYYCPWNLNTAGHGTVIAPGQSCTHPDTVTPTTSYTWRGDTFALTTMDGRTGNLSASFPYAYQTLTGSGQCMLHITADLTKN